MAGVFKRENETLKATISEKDKLLANKNSDELYKIELQNLRKSNANMQAQLLKLVKQINDIRDEDCTAFPAAGMTGGVNA